MSVDCTAASKFEQYEDMKSFDHRQHNRRAWDQLARQKNRFAIPANEADFIEPLKKVDGPGWLGASIEGKRLLCLAAGGGRHGPIYAAAGAKVTVVDISPEMLELDRSIAKRYGFALQVVETSMEDLSMFDDASFDIVIHPVSTCYVPGTAQVFNEVARVTCAGGCYISQHKQPTSLQSTVEPDRQGYAVVHKYQSGETLPPVTKENLIREPGTAEFVHTWQALLGNMCRAGFVIQDLIEPSHEDPAAAPGSFAHRSQFIAPYVRIKALRNNELPRKSDSIIHLE